MNAPQMAIVYKRQNF